MMKAIVCDTRLQLLNALNLTFNHLELNKCDLYIADNINDVDNLIKRLIKEKIYVNVYKFKNVSFHVSPVIKILETIFPYHFLKKSIYEEKYRCVDYDEIYISNAIIFSTMLLLCNSKAKLVYYEDGMGNYNGGIRISDHRYRRIIYKCTGRKYPNFIPTDIYVNNPQLAYSLGVKTNQLFPAIRWSTEFEIKLKEIFAYEEPKVYGERRLVYLTQPNDDENDGIELVDEKVINLIEKNKDSIIIRRHPRDHRNYSGFNIDLGKNMWELLCQSVISETHILIGQYSTSQIISKIMYDKEPWLIFTYPLYKDIYPNEKYVRIEETVERFKNLYRDKSKIIIISDFEHLNLVLEEANTRYR